MQIKFKRLTPTAKTPVRAHKTDAGLDLYADQIKDNVLGQYEISSGISVEIPAGHVGLLFPRSSVKNTGLMLSNGVGVIDAGYRGDVKAVFNVLSRSIEVEPYKVGDRFAQLIILPIPEVEFVEADALSDSDRGTGGYGSSGR